MSEPTFPDETGAVALEKPKKRHRLDYSDADITHALTKVASLNGNVRGAARHLQKEGIDLPPATLRHWVKNTKIDEYQRIRADIVGQIYAAEGERFHQAVSDDLDLNEIAREKLKAALENNDLEGRDLANALRNITVSAATNFDKASLAEGRPTEISVIKDIGPILNSLESMGLDKDKLSAAIDVEAEEIPQVEEGE